MRVHSNFADYVPFALVLLYLVEIQGANPILVHGLCLACWQAGCRVHSGSAGTTRNSSTV